MSARERVVCIGNATVDRTFALDGEVHLKTKNPAVARPIAFGGVARNVAENLARLGVRVELIASVGDDDAGQAVLANCRALGIGVERCVVSSSYPTPQYVAIIDAHNDLVIGGSDMRAIEALPAEHVRNAHAGAEWAWTFADCNLTADVLADLIALPRAAGHRIAIDAVSVAKGRRLPADLHGIDLLFCNAAEARAYLGRDGADPEALAQALHTRGAQSAIMTLGDAGAIVADADGVALVRAERAQVADSTGAGDALIAGTIYAAMQGATIRAALRTGMAAASLAVEATAPVNPALSPASVAARLA